MESNIGSTPCDVCGKSVAEHGITPVADEVETLECRNCDKRVRVELLDADGWCTHCADAMGDDL